MKNYTRKDVDENGDVFYYNEFGKLHRIDGPAYESAHYKEWLVDGKFHRIDGPAIVGDDGTEKWRVNDFPVYGNRFNKLQDLRKAFNDDELLSFLLLERRIVL